MTKSEIEVRRRELLDQMWAKRIAHAKIKNKTLMIWGDWLAALLWDWYYSRAFQTLEGIQQSPKRQWKDWRWRLGRRLFIWTGNIYPGSVDDGLKLAFESFTKPAVKEQFQHAICEARFGCAPQFKH